MRVDYFDEDLAHKSLYERGFPVGFKDDGSSLAGGAVPGAFEKKFVKTASWFASKGVSGSKRGGSKKRLDDGTFFVNNHLRFTVLLHSDAETESSRIVGFEVAPVSVRHDFNGAWNERDPKPSSCSKLNHPSVVFEEDRTKPRIRRRCLRKKSRRARASSSRTTSRFASRP